MKLNAKYVTFSAISLASLYVLYHNERFLIDGSHPAWQHYGPFKWWLLPHGIFGAIVLLFAPLQFSERLRQRFTKAHRVMGRLYVVGAFGLAPLGAYIQYYQERTGAPRSFTVLAFVDAAMLMTTTFFAFLFAFKRKIALHRQWATRCYALALVFIAARFVMGTTAGSGSESTSCRRLSGRASRWRLCSLTSRSTGVRSSLFYRNPRRRPIQPHRASPRASRGLHKYS